MYGSTITFARVKGILVRIASTEASGLQIGGAAAAALTTLFGDTSDYIILKPGGVFLIVNPGATGYVVAATSADILRLTHDAADAANLSYQIGIIGCSS